MPIYEYRCTDCGRKVSLFFRSLQTVSTDNRCPHCGSRELQRLFSRVAIRRGAGAADAMGDDDFGGLLDDLDERDPRALARAMRQMSAETGEEIEPEMAEALERLEAGADPETVMAELDDAGHDDDRLDQPL